MAQCDSCKNEFTGEGRFASSNAILASGKDSSIRGCGDFRVARLHDGEVAERGAEDGSRVRRGEIREFRHSVPKGIEVWPPDPGRLARDSPASPPSMEVAEDPEPPGSGR
jgi:hypothetical protein